MKPNPLQNRKMSSPCLKCQGQGDTGDLLTMCVDCYGSGKEWIICRSCWNRREPWRFRGAKGGFVLTCNDCREKYRDKAKSHGDPRKGLPDKGPLRVKLNVISGNTKTGEIPVSMTSSPTCPTSCAHRGGACYAERHFVGMHWRRLSAGQGMTWDDFCDAIAKLPDGQAWRHNEAGDLPGEGDEIDVPKLRQLVEANRGKLGFTYTHKEVLEDDGMAVQNRLAIMEANEDGFTVNLSADDIEHADVLASLSIGPVAVTLPEYAPEKFKTPEGRSVIICPAQYSKVSCQDCQLCAKPKRKVIIGFWAHGPGKSKIGSTFRLPLFRRLTRAKSKIAEVIVSKRELIQLGRQLLSLAPT